MSIKKKSLVLHLDSLEVIEELSMEQRGELLTAIYDYHKGKELSLTQILKIVFLPFKNQFERDLEKYEKVCKINKEIANRKKGGEKKEEEQINEPLRTVTNREKPEIKEEVNVEEKKIEEGKTEPLLFKEVTDLKDSNKEKKSKNKTIQDGNWFLDLFNKIKKENLPMSTGSKTLTTTSKSNLKKLIEAKYTEEDFIDVINEMFKSNWVIQTGNDTPEHVLRENNFERYFNKAQKVKEDKKGGGENNSEPEFI